MISPNARARCASAPRTCDSLSGLTPTDARPGRSHAAARGRFCTGATHRLPADGAQIEWTGTIACRTPTRILLTAEFIPQPLLPTVLDALNDREWTYTVNEELSLVTFGVGGEHTAYNCALFTDDETRLVTMIAQSPMRIPHEERVSACELLMRANHGLMFGGFDLDFSDGEVRYKVAVDVEGGTLGVEAVHSMITVALDMFELWYPALMKVVYGGVSPEDAVTEVNAGLGNGDQDDGDSIDVEDDDFVDDDSG